MSMSADTGTRTPSRKTRGWQRPRITESCPRERNTQLVRRLEGEDVVIKQENVGEDNMRGGGEWPDPDAPPSDAAPGSLPD